MYVRFPPSARLYAVGPPLPFRDPRTEPVRGAMVLVEEIREEMVREDVMVEGTEEDEWRDEDERGCKGEEGGKL